MQTSKAIAGISYNSEEFLKGKLKEWTKSQIIEFGCIIRHIAEGDEKKDHWHIFMIPAKRLQTVELETASQEPDPEHPDKPLKIVGLSTSKESDWVLYCLHDPMYLAEKGLERVHHYALDDFWSTDDDRLNIIISSLSDSRNGRIEQRLLQMIERGLEWPAILHSGLIPLRYVYPAKIMYDGLVHSGYYDYLEQKKKNEVEEIEEIENSPRV